MRPSAPGPATGTPARLAGPRVPPCHPAAGAGVPEDPRTKALWFGLGLVAALAMPLVLGLVEEAGAVALVTTFVVLGVGAAAAIARPLTRPVGVGIVVGGVAWSLGLLAG
jgi:hypothetical protein